MSTNDESTEGTWARGSRVAAVVILALTALVWLVTFLRPQIYGDGVETSVARMVDAVARGEAMYEPFGTGGAWVNDVYPPLYLWLAAPLRRLCDDGVLAARLVSLCGGLVIAAFVLRSARGASRAVVLGLGALLLAFPFLRWLVAARTDLLAIAFLAGALAVLFPALDGNVGETDKPAAWRVWVAGLCIGGALATKQSLVGFPLGVALAFLWRRRLDAIAMGIGAAIGLGALLLVYRAVYPDVLFHLVFGGQSKYSLEFGLKVAGFALPCALPFLVAFFRAPAAPVENSRPGLLPALVVGSLLWALFASFKGGADSNYYLELYVVLAMGCAVRRARVPLWGLALLAIFTAINVGSEAVSVAKRERSRTSVLAILQRVTGGDRNYFAAQQRTLVNIPLDVGLAYPPARMDYYMAAFEDQGRLSLAPLRTEFCVAHPRLLISRYAIDGKPDYRREYLGGSLPAMVACTTHAVRCEAHFLYSDVPLPLVDGDGCHVVEK